MELKRGYKIGGLQFSICAPEHREAEYFAPFRNDSGSPDLSFNFRFADGITPPALPHLRTRFNEEHYGDGSVWALNGDDGLLMKCTCAGNTIEVEFDAGHPDYFGDHVVLTAMRLPRLMLEHGGVFLHASYIIYNGRAILFTADKQVGKSTQADLWKKHMGAEIINGDRALIRRVDGVWRAYGSPYCGTSKICKNADAEIAAIVILGQAPRNSIRRAATKEALAALMSGISYDTGSRSETEKCLDVCSELVSSLPFFRLDCLPDISAVDTLHRAIMEI